MNGALLLRMLATMAMLAAASSSIASEISDDRANLIFGRDWLPSNDSALVVTGNVRLTPGLLTVDDRLYLELRHLREVTLPETWRGLAYIKQFSLFEVVNSEPVALRPGWYLCGHARYPETIQPSRYVAIGVQPKGDDLYLTAHRLILIFYAVEPSADLTPAQDDACRLYEYYIGY
jgi:hypothetical protein